MEPRSETEHTHPRFNDCRQAFQKLQRLVRESRLELIEEESPPTAGFSYESEERHIRHTQFAAQIQLSWSPQMSDEGGPELALLIFHEGSSACMSFDIFFTSSLAWRLHVETNDAIHYNVPIKGVEHLVEQGRIAEAEALRVAQRFIDHYLSL